MSSGTGESTLEKLYSDRFGEPLTPDEVYGYWLFVSSVILTVIGVGASMAAGEANAARTVGVGLAGIGLAGTLTGLVFGQSYRETATYLAYGGVVVCLVAVVWFTIAYPDGWSWNVGNGTTSGVFLVYLIGMALITMSGVMAPTVVGANQARLKAETALSETRNELEQRQRELKEHRRQLEEREQEVEELERELEEAREEAESQRSRAVEAEQEAESARARAEEAQQEAEAQRTRADEAEQEAESARARVLEVEQRLEELNEELREAEAKLEETEEDVGRLYDSKGTFQLYEDKSDKWRWRLVHQNSNIVATSGQGYSSDRSARKGMRSVKRNALGADVIWECEEEDPEPEPEPVREEPKATFERYTGADGKQRWRLRHDNGRIIAASARGFSSGSSAASNIESVRKYIPPAEYLTFDPAGFTVFRDATGEYRWRLAHRNGRIIGTSSEGYESRPKARSAIETVQEALEEAAVDDESGIRFEVNEENGKHHWRLVGSDDETIAESEEGYSSRSNANDSIERFQEYAPEADALTVGDASLEIYEDKGGDYRWRLRHRNGTIMAKGSRGYSSRSAAIRGINSVKRNAPEAPVEEVGEEEESADDGEGEEGADDGEGEESTE
ncbi:MAG: DUF1508 domain-containing protein [Halobacteriales archaeon]